MRSLFRLWARTPFLVRWFGIGGIMGALLFPLIVHTISIPAVAVGVFAGLVIAWAVLMGASSV